MKFITPGWINKERYFKDIFQSVFAWLISLPSSVVLASRWFCVIFLRNSEVPDKIYYLKRFFFSGVLNSSAILWSSKILNYALYNRSVLEITGVVPVPNRPLISTWSREFALKVRKQPRPRNLHLTAEVLFLRATIHINTVAIHW